MRSSFRAALAACPLFLTSLAACSAEPTGKSTDHLIVAYDDSDPCLVDDAFAFCPAECGSCYTSGGDITGGGGGGGSTGGDLGCSTIRATCQTKYNNCTARCVANHSSCACQGFCFNDYQTCTGSCYPPDGPNPTPNDCTGW